MNIQVNPHTIKIIQRNSINEKEINISKCYFTFTDEITNDFVKEAYFTLNGNTYKEIIENNQCDIPGEVLTQKGKVEVGVVAYKVEDEETIKRYNPKSTYINTLSGSLKEAQNSQPITPSEMEQFEQALQDALANIDEGLGISKIEKTSTSGDVDTYTIYYGDGKTSTFTVTNGHTPVKNVDYWTAEDKADIKAYCDSLVIGALEGSY